MDKLERIRNLMEELANAIQDAYSKCTRSNLTVDMDGYRSISVEEWEADDGVTPSEAKKRRYLLCQYRFSDGEWCSDQSSFHNDYLKSRRVLLEKEGN